MYLGKGSGSAAKGVGLRLPYHARSAVQTSSFKLTGIEEVARNHIASLGFGSLEELLRHIQDLRPIVAPFPLTVSARAYLRSPETMSLGIRGLRSTREGRQGKEQVPSRKTDAVRLRQDTEVRTPGTLLGSYMPHHATARACSRSPLSRIFAGRLVRGAGNARFLEYRRKI